MFDKMKPIKSKIWTIFNKICLFAGCWCLMSCQYFYEQSLKDKKREEMIDTKIAIITNYLNQKKRYEALEQVRELQKEHTHHTKVLNISGLTHLALNNSAQAEKLLKKAYQQSSLTFVGLNLSSALIEQNKMKAARKLLKTLKQDRQYERKERILHNIGLTYQKEGRCRRAQKYYRMALIENPVFYLSALHIAHCYERQSQTKKAIEAYQQASKFCPSCYEPVRELYKLLNQKKRFQQAYEIVNKYINQKELASTDKKEALSLLNKKEGKKNKELF